MSDYENPAEFPFALADAATIEVDASQVRIAEVTFGGNRTIAAPANPTDGKLLIFDLKQDVVGGRTVTWSDAAGGFSFDGSSAPVLSTSPGRTDRITFIYYARYGKWMYQHSSTLDL